MTASKIKKGVSNVSLAVPSFLSFQRTDHECSCDSGCLVCLRRWINEHLLALLIILGVIVGVILGLSLKTVWNNRDLWKIHYLEFPGQILYNILNLFTVPLVTTSLVRALASRKQSSTHRVETVSVLYFISTTYFSSILGILLALSIKPKQLVRLGSKEDRRSNLISSLDSLVEFLGQVIPDNIVTACFQGVKTDYIPVTFQEYDDENTTTVANRNLFTEHHTNIVGLTVVSITLGLMISKMGDDGEPLRRLVESANDIVMASIDIMVWYTPIGLVFLVAGKVVSSDINNMWNESFMYLVTVHLGLIFHGAYFLPTTFYLMTWKNPLLYCARQLRALLIAWGTASSYATLPITMTCLIEKNRVSRVIVDFVAPVGATVNMNGSAMTSSIAAIYIAHVNGISLEIVELVIISAAATFVSITAPGLHGQDLYALYFVLNAVGIPTKHIAVVSSVDWFVDRMRTVVNVWGDAVGSGVIDHYFGDICQSESEEEWKRTSFLES